MNAAEIKIIILTGLVFFISLASFIVYFIVFHRKKQYNNLIERELLVAEYNQQLLQTRLEIQEQTLHHLSYELHDNIGQILSLASLHLNTIPTSDTAKLLTTSDLVDKAIADLRNLSKSLNSDRVIEMGIVAAIGAELDIIEKTRRFSTRLDADGSFNIASDQTTLIVFRMVQEALNNIIKHSSATAIRISLETVSDGLLIRLSDNGKGFDVAEKMRNGAGLGLKNILSRAAMIKTDVQFDSRPGEGTDVLFHIKS